ncbi:MAG: hypothetical protein ACXAC2_20135 [Candidatus Kariarchaeaceae archaeon]|jgi:hypothetical protein
MEKVSIEFSEEEINRIQKFRIGNEPFEAIIRRLVLTHVSEIPKEIWSNNLDKIFDEFEETFQKLAE